MAEINNTQLKQRKATGVAKSKKLSTRVDLTPMVDLGFLLITFFIFTTSLATPTTMHLRMPNDNGIPTPVKESCTLTLITGEKGIVWYYEGKTNNAPSNLHHVPMNQIRQVIINKKQHTPPPDFFVIIKPATSSNYKDLIDILDEMTINDVKSYALTDITPGEEALIK